MNRDDELASRIARHLDHGTTRIDSVAAAALHIARQRALDNMQTQPAWQFALAGGAAAHSVLRYLNPRYLLPLLALLIAISGMIYWQNLQHIDELADVDANILSGDLPIDAYLDKGLDAWLKR